MSGVNPILLTSSCDLTLAVGCGGGEGRTSSYRSSTLVPGFWRAYEVPCNEGNSRVPTLFSLFFFCARNRAWTKRPCLVAPRSTHPTDCLPVPVTVSLSQSNHRESRECEQASITNTNTGRQRPSCLCGGGVSRDPALPVLWWGMCFKLPGKR